MSLSLSDLSRIEPARAVPPARQPRVFVSTAWHSLLWLVVANAVGVLLAALLIAPGLNAWLGEWTYGRWMPVHLNLQLYGWSSLPLIAFLFHVYGADHEPAARWCRAVLWVWSSALALGALSWLGGHTSGKLFLDWTGYSRVLFPLALCGLWLLLAFALARGWHTAAPAARTAKVIGLALLAAIPPILYIAADPSIYPPINPDSGGPTGASQLESALIIVAILLLLPFGLTRLKHHGAWRKIGWAVFAAEALLCLTLGRADVSNHRPAQYISLGSLLVWLPLMPAYYSSFAWRPNTRRWRTAFLVWWSLLLPTGWALFLPGVLDRLKFTDGLVGHALLAMAGFTSSLLIFALVQLLGDEDRIFHQAWSFYLWHGSVFFYVALMFIAGFQEGFDPAFSIVPGTERSILYALRLLLGIFMLAASADWLFWASRAAFHTAPSRSREQAREQSREQAREQSRKQIS